MMNIEKQLSKADLNVFKQQPIYLLAKQIVKYQKYKTSIIRDKINTLNFTPATAGIYISKGISYINSGKKSKGYTHLYTNIDKCIEECVTPLTPKEDERRKVYKSRQTKPEPLKQDNPIIPQKPLTQKFAYGVKVGNCVWIYDNEKECNLFIDGCKASGNKNVKLVHITNAEEE